MYLENSLEADHHAILLSSLNPCFHPQLSSCFRLSDLFGELFLSGIPMYYVSSASPLRILFTLHMAVGERHLYSPSCHNQLSSLNPLSTPINLKLL